MELLSASAGGFPLVEILVDLFWGHYPGGTEVRVSDNL